MSEFASGLSDPSYRRLELSELCGLKAGHAFGDALAALIASFSNGEFERGMVKWGWVNLEIEIYSPKPGRFRTLADRLGRAGRRDRNRASARRATWGKSIVSRSMTT
jgi:hypothetical protein